MNTHLRLILAASMGIALSACSTPNNTYQGTAIGATIGTITGAVIGYQLDRDNGAYVGGATGALVGGAIGNNYDQLGTYSYNSAYNPPPAAPYGYNNYGNNYPPPNTPPASNPYYR